VDRKPDDQYAVLGLGEQLAQHDTGVARRAGDVGPARRQLVNGCIGARLQLRGEGVERQCCVLRSHPRSERRGQFGRRLADRRDRVPNHERWCGSGQTAVPQRLRQVRDRAGVH